jgi:O-antigen/teichoic acid export membrane protein
MYSFINRWLTVAHIVALQKMVQAGTGVITAALIVLFLSPHEQGYYVTLGSLLSSYTLLDLGLSVLLVQVSARYFAGLEWTGNGGIIPQGERRTAFLALIRWSIRWYAQAGVVTLALIPIGWMYFHFSASNTGEVAWQLPWICIVVAIALSMPAIGFLAILEGAGRIRGTYLLRMGQYILGALMAWTLFLSGKGLFAQAAAPMALTIAGLYWARSRYRELVRNCLDAPNTFSWRRDIWPQHKRVAVSWFSGYLFLHIPVPILFYFVGARDAGQMGLSMTVANVLGAIAMSSVTAIAPYFTTVVAQQDIATANRLFRHAFIKSMSLLLAASLCLVVLVAFLQPTPFSQRVLSPLQLVFLFGIFACFHAINGLAIYFRAFGREPLAIPSLLAALLQIAGVLVAVHFYGMNGLLLVMLGVYFLLGGYVINCLKQVAHA